jgi:hypothetical protein
VKKKKKPPPIRWKQQERRLRPNHSWRASEGHNVLVLDRGVVSLEFPDGWVIDPTEDCIRVLDKAPPNDDCGLGVSYQLLPPIDWTGLTVAMLVEAAERNDKRKILEKYPIVWGRRPGIEWAWRRMRFEDTNEHRPAFNHLGIAVGSDVLCLLTFVYWEPDRERCEPVWSNVLESLVLGQRIEDPTRGPRLA